MPNIPKIDVPTPAVLKPRKLWTGKQIVSCILQALTGGFAAPADKFSADCKAKVAATMWLGKGRPVGGDVGAVSRTITAAGDEDPDLAPLAISS